MKTKKIIMAIAVALATSCLAVTAVAQKRSESGVIRLEETVIEGRVAKPNAFFINTRQALVYEAMPIEESFIKEISKVVTSGPF